MSLLKTLVLSSVFFPWLVRAAEAPSAWLEDAKTRCALPTPAESFVTQSDFKWNMSIEEISQAFDKINTSGKRLKDRAYTNKDGQLVLPLQRVGDLKEIPLPPTFLYSVKLHVEKALKLGYADHVIFPDMGHSHFLIPTEHFSEIQGMPQQFIYEKFFNDAQMKIVYHTAEQLRMKNDRRELIPDPVLMWRYFTRNVVGDNAGLGQIDIYKNLTGKFNTIGEEQAPGYKWWGAGFNISTSQNGCFSYVKTGSTYYFDLSLSDLPE